MKGVEVGHKILESIIIRHECRKSQVVNNAAKNKCKIMYNHHLATYSLLIGHKNIFFLISRRFCFANKHRKKQGGEIALTYNCA